MSNFRYERDGRVLKLSGELTIQNAESLKMTLLQALGRAGGLRLDLSAVTAVDAAGSQLLWSAFRTEGNSGQGVALESLPVELKQALLDAGYALREESVCRIQTDNSLEREER
jgi:anti-anti-sigma regulatory factor